MLRFGLRTVDADGGLRRTDARVAAASRLSGFHARAPVLTGCLAQVLAQVLCGVHPMT